MVPVLIEAVMGPEHASLNVCRKIVAALLKDHVPDPIPFATMETELDVVLTALVHKKIEPCLFLVNTFQAESMIKRVDTVAGTAPIILLRRAIQPLLGTPEHQYVEITYGSATADDVASGMAKLIERYLVDRNLSGFDDYAHHQRMAQLGSGDDYPKKRRSGLFRSL